MKEVLTKKMLEEAFKSLMEEKSIEQISTTPPGLQIVLMYEIDCLNKKKDKK